MPHDLMYYNPNYEHNLVLGRHTGVKVWSKIGYNPGIPSGVFNIVANFGGVYTPLYVPSVISFVSTSANDTSNGTGCRSITVYGVDVDYNEIVEDVLMNGLTPVNTINSYYGLNKVSVKLSGDLRQNDGVITGTASDASIQAQILSGEGSTQQMIFFTPSNKKSLLTYLMIGAVKLSGSPPVITIKGFLFNHQTNSKYEVLRFYFDTTAENIIKLDLDNVPFIIDSKTVFWIECLTDSAGSVVSGRMTLSVHDDVHVL